MTKKSLDQQIILSLQEGPVKSTRLVNELAEHNKMTVQAIYVVLRKLKKEGVIVYKHRVISLSTVWIEKQVALFQYMKFVYLDSLEAKEFSFGELGVGDKISYDFHNPVLLDQMWGHLFIILTKKLAQQMPVMIYNSHFWFPIVRLESERTIFESLEKNGHKAYFSSSSKSDLDRLTIKNFLSNNNHSFSLSVDYGFESNFYINVLGDYLIEVFLDKNVSKKLEEFFAKNVSLTNDKVEVLRDMVTAKGKNRLVVSHNPKKAKKLRARLARSFLLSEVERGFL